MIHGLIYTGSERKINRYVFNVLAYSAAAQRFKKFLALQYHVHNSAGIKVVVVNGLQIVTAYAHANAGGLEPCRNAFKLRCY